MVPSVLDPRDGDVTNSLFSISSPLLVYNLFVYNLISLLFLFQVRHLSELTRSGLDQDQNECWTQPTAEEEVAISFKHFQNQMRNELAVETRSVPRLSYSTASA
ncbi:hypothetical protein N665_0346s0017 [Sinapis alba]|nr:hypothetical protein N665_0346s0017 [Sinapis alba]